MTFEIDTEPLTRARDAIVTAALKQAGIEVSSHSGHTMVDCELLRSKYTPTSAAGASQYLGKLVTTIRRLNSQLTR